MKFSFLDSFLVFVISSLPFKTYYSDLFLTDYLSYSCLLTNFMPEEGDQKQPSMELLMVSQTKQVYSMVNIY